ncbi:MAG: hypothetical protein MI976_20270 [Pseudomonadales bacterium]|nr:hypothetical protein [Pseudomonadales bacterium]
MDGKNAFKLSVRPIAQHFVVLFAALLLTACGSDYDLNIAQPDGGTIVSEDGFISCGATCSHTYAEDTSVVLTAIPEGDNLFMNWTGDCSGIDDVCNLTITEELMVGANFADPDTPDIGSTFSTVAGSTISLRFTGSTDYWDAIGLFEPTDSDNSSPLVSVRVGVGPGVVTLRVPTDIPDEGKELQLRMYNNSDETIVIDDNIFIADYDASMSFATTEVTPEGTISITYEGSTNYWDRIAAFPIGGSNSEQLVATRIGSEPTGTVDFKVPWYEGEFEVRMLNNNDETIVVGPNITLAYGASHVSSTRIVTPSSNVNVSYSGATDYWDRVALFAQENPTAVVTSRTGAGSGSINLAAPATTGIYDLKLINNHNYPIANGERIAVLRDDQTEIFSAPEIAGPSELIEIAYSGSGTGVGQHWVGLFAQGEPNENYHNRTEVDSTSVGFSVLETPETTGIYEIRLVDGANNTLAVGNYVSVLNQSAIETFIQDNVIAGETIRVVFTGSSDYWDYVEVYEIGDEENYSERVRIGSASDASFVNLRVPTQPGLYGIRMVNGDDLLAIGNQFTVAPYQATLSLSSETARPQEYITVTYSGLNNYWDKIAFYEVGAPNENPVQQARLGSQFEGETSVQVPGMEGVYEVRLINNKDELIADGGTITLSYEAVGVNALSIVAPGATVDISYSGSTDYWDRVGLYAQDQTSAAVSKNTQGVETGLLQVTAPATPGVYNLKLVNNEGVLAAEGNTVSVLDETQTAIYAGHATAIPGEEITIAYSGSTGTDTTPDRVGIFVQGSNNSSPLDFAVLAEGSVGTVALSAPVLDGIYDIRLINHDGETIVSGADFLRVVDETLAAVHIPISVVAGSTHKVVFSGATDYWDGVAIYEASVVDPADYISKTRVGAGSGIHEVRVPTIAGSYLVRLISNSNGVIAEGHSFVVEPYSTTLTLASVTTPTASIPVEYTGTTNYWDRVAIYEVGEMGLNYLTATRIPPIAAIAYLTVPSLEGVYDVKAVNDKGEVMYDAGSITLTYDAITITGPETVALGESVEVTYAGSTQYWDNARLIADQVSRKEVVSGLRIGSQAAATVDLSPPAATGLYQLEMVNQGGIQMADGGTVAVLDSEELEVFVSPRLIAPSEAVTVAFSGSATASNTLGIYIDGADNSAPLSSAPVAGSEGKQSFTGPAAPGVYDVRLVNALSDTLTQADNLYVLDVSSPGVYAPHEVRAGETLPIAYAGSTDYWDKVAFYPVGSTTNADTALSVLRVGSNAAAAVDIRVPTIEGQYELRLTNNTYSSVIAVSTVITVLPYDGDVDPE